MNLPDGDDELEESILEVDGQTLHVSGLPVLEGMSSVPILPVDSMHSKSLETSMSVVENIRVLDSDQPSVEVVIADDGGFLMSSSSASVVPAMINNIVSTPVKKIKQDEGIGMCSATSLVLHTLHTALQVMAMTVCGKCVVIQFSINLLKTSSLCMRYNENMSIVFFICFKTSRKA